MYPAEIEVQEVLDKFCVLWYTKPDCWAICRQIRAGESILERLFAGQQLRLVAKCRVCWRMCLS